MNRVELAAASLCLFGLATGVAAEDQVTLTPQDQSIVVKIGDQEFTTYHYAPNQPKPYFSPVLAPGGAVITRPLENPKDHPHHKGIWLSVDEVNGVKFWAEKGKIVSKSVKADQVGPIGRLSIKNDWMGPEKPILHEATTVLIYPERLMTFYTTFTKPADLPTVTFEDTKEGLFGIRFVDSMRGSVGGVISNADGHTGEKECWGKASKWVDYSGKIGDHMYGVTIMDHPANFRPSRYHCRDYGLFSISPFGEGAYQGDASKAKPVTLDSQHPELQLTYGLYVHPGDATEGKVAAEYEKYLQETHGK
ncbi:MAG: PmoA family protein [Planctomycetaceae bacterium]